MCWCNPKVRTPNCGGIGCHPPVITASAPPVVNAQPAPCPHCGYCQHCGRSNARHYAAQPNWRPDLNISADPYWTTGTNTISGTPTK